jgi:replicative DNA helicase
MLSPQCWTDIRDGVKAEDFSRQLHRDLFMLLSRLNEKEPAADALVVMEEWTRLGMPDENLDYISRLADAGDPYALPRYLGAVVEASCRRRMLEAGLKLQQAAREADDVQEALADGEKALQALAGSVAPDVWVSQRDLMERQWREYGARGEAASRGDPTGLASGFYELDRITGGMRPGELIIVAARPGMGKTALALNIATRTAKRAPVAIYSKEMPMGACFDRCMAAEAQLQAELIRDGIPGRDVQRWQRLTDAAERIGDLPIWWADVALKVSALRSLARRLKARVPGLGLLVIDYLQLLDPEPEDRKQMREVQVATMSRGLKALAKELGIPVLCLAQLNRSVEQRADRRPNMSDLRESGAIEQDADQVLFIYREDYYKPDSQRKGIAEIIVAKNRSGRMGTAELVWKPDYQAFLSLDRREGY